MLWVAVCVLTATTGFGCSGHTAEFAGVPAGERTELAQRYSDALDACGIAEGSDDAQRLYEWVLLWHSTRKVLDDQRQQFPGRTQEHARAEEELASQLVLSDDQVKACVLRHFVL